MCVRQAQVSHDTLSSIHFHEHPTNRSLIFDFHCWWIATHHLKYQNAIPPKYLRENHFYKTLNFFILLNFNHFFVKFSHLFLQVITKIPWTKLFPVISAQSSRSQWRWKRKRKKNQNSPPLGKSQTDFHRAIKYKQTMQIIPIHKQPSCVIYFILLYVFEYFCFCLEKKSVWF